MRRVTGCAFSFPLLSTVRSTLTLLREQKRPIGDRKIVIPDIGLILFGVLLASASGVSFSVKHQRRRFHFTSTILVYFLTIPRKIEHPESENYTSFLGNWPGGVSTPRSPDSRLTFAQS